MRAIIMIARMITTQSNSLPTSAPMKNDFEHEPAASVGQDQESEPGQGPAQRHAAAPAADVATQQQHAEGQPRQQRDYGLVVERPDLSGKQPGEIEQE